MVPAKLAGRAASSTAALCPPAQREVDRLRSATTKRNILPCRRRGRWIARLARKTEGASHKRRCKITRAAASTAAFLPRAGEEPHARLSHQSPLRWGTALSIEISPPPKPDRPASRKRCASPAREEKAGGFR